MRLPWLSFSMGGRATVFSQLLLLIAASYPRAASTMLVHPYMRAITSSAVCESEYGWMNNHEGSSPCVLIAYVMAACVGDSWTQSALPSGSHYDAPDESTSSPCSCSQSCYNLMMACTYCQGSNYTGELIPWPTFIQNCSTSYTDVYFPSGYTLLSNQTIPYWASIDPTTWEGQIWNYEQAYQYYQTGKADLVPTLSTGSTGSHSSDLGAIVGGTVGGVASLLLLALGIYILCKRQRYRRVRAAGAVDVNKGPNPSWQMHNGQLSDQSTAGFLQQRIAHPMTGTVTQTAPSLNWPFPLTSYTSGTDPTSYNTSGAQPHSVIPML
ncbi:hypothetical protein EDD15DRAFT_1822274 [Pisolithus albus]|nr:hypothetical protein EDD15DRAFT_1822274 [Pisolithus albus]